MRAPLLRLTSSIWRLDATAPYRHTRAPTSPCHGHGAHPPDKTMAVALNGTNRPKRTDKEQDIFSIELLIYFGILMGIYSANVRSGLSPPTLASKQARAHTHMHDALNRQFNSALVYIVLIILFIVSTAHSPHDVMARNYYTFAKVNRTHAAKASQRARTGRLV